MVDVLVKTSILVGVAALLTRRSGHRAAADAHRLWMIVLLSPLIVLASNAVLPPVAFLVPRLELARATGLEVRPGWMVAAYALVAGLLLCRVAAGLWAVRTLRHRARPLAAAELTQLRALAGEPRLDLRESDLLVPVTAGALRPYVILPVGWRELSLPALTAILRHEAAHVRRRDCGVALAGAMLEATCWCIPAVWIASTRLRWFAEIACDAEAERGMGDGEYAAVLLDLSAGWAGAPSPRYAVTAGAETHVARRIRLLIEARDRASGRGALLPVAMIALLLATILSTGVRVSSSRSVQAPLPGFGHGPGQGHLHRH